MDISVWYVIERISMLSVIAFLAVFAIYQWKIASVRPSLLAKFRDEAEAMAREKMAAEVEEHQAVVDDFARRIKDVYSSETGH